MLPHHSTAQEMNYKTKVCIMQVSHNAPNWCNSLPGLMRDFCTARVCCSHSLQPDSLSSPTQGDTVWLKFTPDAWSYTDNWYSLQCHTC